MPKPFYLSRTLWINLIACVAILVQHLTGTAFIDAEGQVAILAVVNLVLRIITNQGVTRW